jgi:hypothetical protein
MVPVCAECDGPPVARYGPELAYDPEGFPTALAVDAGMAKAMGVAESEKLKRRAYRDVSPMQAKPKHIVDLDVMKHEGIRRARTGAADKSNHRSRRQKNVI